ncbi:hypothetical protein PHISCL_04828 [Aspergillus sclerotialis]|uniref:Uncharacterized protein n=1 Tax=Aspergillus sclerotialis TaxID=2070753 RepID=A0A3A2ZIA7_9EURO|nr:hypothetical protein PHISCL_04828 [Aspergillus sclerotialis]
MASVKKVQRLVLTGAVTAITIAGTLYGASMKMQQEVTEVNQKRREATIDEQIEYLRSTRQNLSMKKDLVQQQIRDLDARIEDKKRKGLATSNSERPREG